MTFYYLTFFDSVASIGWIDFSQAHRNRVNSVLELLKPEGTVDELGLGTIRDAIADQLFPGISTIQTRAKYFFIVPYILYDYQVLKRKNKTNKTAAKYLEEQEYEVMWQLAEAYEYQERNGVIGITKRKPHKIARRPSTIYWNGIGTYNFIQTGGLSFPAFVNRTSVKNLQSLLAEAVDGDDNKDDIDAGYDNDFKIMTPYVNRWRDNLNLELTQDEAEFFRDRILDRSRKTLIGQVLINETLRDQFFAAGDFMDFAKRASLLDLEESLQRSITQAHDFSQIMYGVHLAYNCQLQMRAFQNRTRENEFKNWLRDLKNVMLDFKGFHPQSLPGKTRLGTKQFIESWWKQIHLNFPDLDVRDELIKKQEFLVKGNKAKIQWDKMDNVREGEWIGLTFFDYRFTQAKRILQDIIKELDKLT